MTVWTIGHSTRALEDFVSILLSHRIEALVDVRRFPASRRFPQFHADVLSAALATHGIAYCWIESLGGRRRAGSASPNTGWRHAAFRGYADHIATEEFAAGLTELMLIAGGLRTTIMCAEILWWRCHRRLIADVLTVLGERVEHIRDERVTELHRLGPPARIVNGELTYRA
jgi:uncharacterized protein (DUF488 family)